MMKPKISDKATAFRASILHFLDDPRDKQDSALAYFDDGLLLVEKGRVVQVGDAQQLLPLLPAATDVIDYRGKLILPGFVDTHIHFAQTDIVAAHGSQVLEWLERYTFPVERQFADPEHASEVADFSIGEMLRNGTTTSMVFATVHRESVDAIFRAAQSRGMCMIAGKVLMDNNCPDALCEPAEAGFELSQALIRDWHHRPGTRLRYAVTPRFAPTSTERQLELSARLLDEHAGVYLQTHLAENQHECAWVRELFPWSKSYLDVYDHFGLVRPRSVFAHCIHLADVDRRLLARKGAAMSFCPTSNLFLGSGLFDLDAARSHELRVGLGTDIGGGTSFSLLRTLHEAYKVMQLRGQTMDALGGLYQITLGGAKALDLDGEVGNFAADKYADFVVLDQAATPLIARRIGIAKTLAEKLFVMMMMGDEHVVAATYVQGVRQFARGDQ